MPKTNTEFWKSKIDGNRRRDADTTTRLQNLGFTVLRFWEHEAPADVVDRVIHMYQALRDTGAPPQANPPLSPPADSRMQPDPGARDPDEE
jgi:DNA mismatch endonuclease (patch repair protein)